MNALRKLLALKPGYMTTEFWSHLIVSAISLLVALGWVPVGLPANDQTWVQLGAFAAAAICSGLYALSRGKVKAGASSLVSLLNNAITTQLANPGSTAEGRKLLAKVLPELDAVSGSGELTKIWQAIQNHESWLSNIEKSFVQPHAVTEPVPVLPVPIATPAAAPTSSPAV